MRILVLLLAMTSSLVAIPITAQADEGAPVLWEGEIQTPAGRPAGAEVVAYVRPPASQMETGGGLVAVARTTSDASGHFTLRAAPSDAFRAAQDEAGWVTVMVAALGPQGMSLAVDSVAWKPEPADTRGSRVQAGGAAGGRWVTSPAELLVPPAGHGRGFQPASVDEEEPVVTGERPTMLVLRGGGASAAKRSSTPMSGGHAPEGMSCWPEGSQEVGVRPVAVGELHLNDAWGGLFEYTNTRSTSFQVGVSYDGGSWQAGGSVSMDDTSQLAQEQTVPPRELGATRFYGYKADMLFKRFKWGCIRGTSTQVTAYTLEPVDWTGGLVQREDGNPPSCDLRFLSSVVPGGKMKRLQGSSITLGGSISVAGFSGSMTSTVSKAVRYQWYNDRPYHRNVCGSTNRLNKNTRAATQA